MGLNSDLCSSVQNARVPEMVPGPLEKFLRLLEPAGAVSSRENISQKVFLKQQQIQSGTVRVHKPFMKTLEAFRCASRQGVQ